jgi:hypothetical protein
MCKFYEDYFKTVSWELYIYFAHFAHLNLETFYL